MNCTDEENTIKNIKETCNKIDLSTINNLTDVSYTEIDSKLNLNEPVYCFCKYISFGNMIKCDNDKVFFLIIN